MRKIILIFIVVLMGLKSYAQEQPRYVYCIVSGSSKFMGNKITIRIDFGDNIRFFADNRMKDPKTGRLMVFNSIVDALNYMGNQGWELVQTYAEMINGSTSSFNYLMKKRFSDLDQETQMEYLKE